MNSTKYFASIFFVTFALLALPFFSYEAFGGDVSQEINFEPKVLSNLPLEVWAMPDNEIEITKDAEIDVCSNGKYLVNNRGGFQSNPGEVKEGDTILFAAKTSTEHDSTTNATLTIGDVSETLELRTTTGECELEGVTIDYGETHKFYKSRQSFDCESNSRVRRCLISGNFQGNDAYRFSECEEQDVGEVGEEHLSYPEGAPPLQYRYNDWPEPGTGVHEGSYYSMSFDDRDNPKDKDRFSIFVPAGTSMLEMTMNTNYETKICYSIKSNDPEKCSRPFDRTVEELFQSDMYLTSGGGGSKSRIFNDYGLDTSDWTQGKWISFDLNNRDAVPWAYSARMRIDTEHPYYHRPGETPGGSPQNEPDYPQLKKTLEEFPKADSGITSSLFPYEKTSSQNIDGSKFSIWVPASTRTVHLIMGTNRRSTLKVTSDIPEIGDFEINFGRGGYDSLKQTVIQTSSMTWDEDSSGRWVLFEFSNGATPSYYYSMYRDIDTDHPNYSPPPD